MEKFWSVQRTLFARDALTCTNLVYIHAYLSFVSHTAVQEKENRCSDTSIAAHKKEIQPRVMESDLLLKVTALTVWKWFLVKECIQIWILVNLNSLAQSEKIYIYIFAHTILLA